MTEFKPIPIFDSSTATTSEEFRAAYDSVHCVWFRATKKKKRRKLDDISHHHIESLLHAFQSATPKDQASWCVENDNDKTTSVKPAEFLSSHGRQEGYCSFILQDDTHQNVSNFTETLAGPIFPTLEQASSDDNCKIQTSHPIWIFVGRNNDQKTPLEGRSEHTDNIQHDGTVHYQLIGSKTWYLRPTQDLRDQCCGTLLDDSYKLTLSAGDRIVINTRLWWHRTEIPNNCSNVSISYAQDVYLDDRQLPEEEAMSNVEGAWAVGFIPKGTELLTDSSSTEELPMRRTKDKNEANCKLVVVKEEGERPPQKAVVTLRDIQESEFFILWDESLD